MLFFESTRTSVFPTKPASSESRFMPSRPALVKVATPCGYPVLASEAPRER
jgi:hypothetical protein